MLKPILEWEQVRTLRAVIPHHVVHRTLASETVLLNIETGHYYGMDEVGGRFFDVLRDAGSVGTAVAAFVGLAQRGPTNEPTLVTNWAQFVNNFGDFMEGSYLAHAVYGYFLNGGGSCYIVRIGGDSPMPQAKAEISAAKA